MTAHIEQIIDEHSAHLLRLAYFYTKNRHAAEDIVQDVLIKFCEAPYEERGQLRAYLTRLTINKSKDYLKSWALIALASYQDIPMVKEVIDKAVVGLNDRYKKDRQSYCRLPYGSWQEFVCFQDFSIVRLWREFWER